MNTNQIANIATSVIQPLMALLIAHGVVNSNEAESVGGAVAALVVFFASHNWHATPAPENKMKNIGNPLMAFLILPCLLFCGSAKAQTASTNAPADFFSGGVTLPQWLTITESSITSSGILQASNYAASVYMTYSANADTHVGGGVLVIYNVPSLTHVDTNGAMGVGLALGADWLGQWSLVSGNVTLKADTHPLASIGLLSFLPDSIKNSTWTPIAIVGIGQPMSGGSGAATLWDVGYGVRFGHWLGGQFGAGFTWGAWMNAGKYSGHREHIFVDWSWQIPHS
jgi:hypothetical protein